MVVTIWFMHCDEYVLRKNRLTIVMVKLAAGPRFLRPMEGIDVAEPAPYATPTTVGLAPMVDTLLRDVCHPLATPNTCDAYCSACA